MYLDISTALSQLNAEVTHEDQRAIPSMVFHFPFISNDDYRGTEKKLVRKMV